MKCTSCHRSACVSTSVAAPGVPDAHHSPAGFSGATCVTRHPARVRCPRGSLAASAAGRPLSCLVESVPLLVPSSSKLLSHPTALPPPLKCPCPSNPCRFPHRSRTADHLDAPEVLAEGNNKTDEGPILMDVSSFLIGRFTGPDEASPLHRAPAATQSSCPGLWLH